MSSLQKRKNWWYYRYRDNDGIQHMRSTRTGVLEIAQRRQEYWDRQLIQNGRLDKRIDSLSELFELFKSDCLKYKTEKQIKDRVHCFNTLREIHHKHIKNLTRDDVASIVSSRYSTSYRRKILNLLRNMIRYAISKNLLFEDITEGFVVKSCDDTRFRQNDYLTPDHTQSFLDYAAHHFPAYEPMFRLSYLTGMRLGEVRDLEWSEVSLAFQKIFLSSEKVKSRREQYIALSKEAVSLLNTLPHDSHYVFPNRYARTVKERGGLFPYSQRHPARIAKKVLDALGLGAKGISGHIFRKSFISHLVQEKASPKEVQELARHSSINTTMNYYARLDPSHLTGALSKLPAMIYNNRSSSDVLLSYNEVS